MPGDDGQGLVTLVESGSLALTQTAAATTPALEHLYQLGQAGSGIVGRTPIRKEQEKYPLGVGASGQQRAGRCRDLGKATSNLLQKYKVPIRPMAMKHLAGGVRSQ